MIDAFIFMCISIVSTAGVLYIIDILTKMRDKK